MEKKKKLVMVRKRSSIWVEKWHFRLFLCCFQHWLHFFLWNAKCTMLLISSWRSWQNNALLPNASELPPCLYIAWKHIIETSSMHFPDNGNTCSRISQKKKKFFLWMKAKCLHGLLSHFKPKSHSNPVRKCSLCPARFPWSHHVIGNLWP